MKPSAFEYLTPSTVTEVLELLERYGDEAKIIAGGQSLVPLMNFRLARPEVLIDINGIEELDYIRENGDGGSQKIALPLEQGTKVKILESNGGWHKVKAEITGWVTAKYVDK